MWHAKYIVLYFSDFLFYRIFFLFRVRNNKNKRIPCSQAYTWQHSLMKLTAKSTVQYYIDMYILYSLKIDYIFQTKIRRRMLALPAYYCDGIYYKLVYWERCPWGVFYIEQHPHDNISSSHLYYRLCIYTSWFQILYPVSDFPLMCVLPSGRSHTWNPTIIYLMRP